MEPKKIEFDVGKTVWQQPVSLIREKEGGRDNWHIKIHPINQRDEGGWIYGLTRDTILRMAEAVKDLK